MELAEKIKCMKCGIDSIVLRQSSDGINASILLNIGWVVKCPIMIGISEWLFCCSMECYQLLLNLKKLEYNVTDEIVEEAKKANQQFTETIPKYIQKLSSAVLFTGKAWKHHISEDFEQNSVPTYPNGAGEGATIFIDYSKMLEYLNQDGRKWHIAELNLKNEPLVFEFGNNFMATILSDIDSEKGFIKL